MTYTISDTGISEALSILMKRNGELRRQCYDGAELLGEKIEFKSAYLPLNDLEALIVVMWRENNELFQQYLEIQKRVALHRLRVKPTSAFESENDDE